MKRFLVFMALCVAMLLACRRVTDDIEPAPERYRTIEIPVISQLD